LSPDHLHSVPTRRSSDLLVADSDQIPDDDSGMVTLMTVHTAKGLEFSCVFVTGLEDGTFPHARSLGEQKELAEERRLAYVALTRSEEHTSELQSRFDLVC